MNGQENLIPFTERTEDEQREIARKGGVASGEARRKKRDAKAAARLILNLPASESLEANLKKLGVKEEDFTNMVAIMARAFTKAMSGDISAMSFLIDMAGASPRFKMAEEQHKKAMRDEEKSSNAVDDWISSIPDTEL